jgi:hypothetical protein
MSMRHAALVLVLLATPAWADTFGGFSGVDRPYLMTPDRVCTPLKIANGAATGVPACEKAAADVIARLSFKPPIPQRGAKAAFAATASGKTLTVTRASGKVATWDAVDPIVKVVEVYASQYEDRVAVAYTLRRMGKEITDVVGFDLGQGQTAIRQPDSAQPDPTQPQPPVQKPVEDPKVTAALTAARKAPKGAKALAAWKAVLALDAANSEALYGVAAAQLAAKATADALATLGQLAASAKPDAIEWLIQARFDPAFAALRGDAKFRTVVGLDRKPTTVYEKVMGFGGQWEQTGTSCDKPEVRLTLQRDRSFKLRVKTTCEGQVYDTPFKGTWRVDGNRLVLGLPNKGKVTVQDEAPCSLDAVGDETGLHCLLGKDIEFTVLPTRR